MQSAAPTPSVWFIRRRGVHRLVFTPKRKRPFRSSARKAVSDFPAVAGQLHHSTVTDHSPQSANQANALCRAIGRSDQAEFARARLTQPEPSSAHCRFTTAVAPADPQSLAGVTLRRQLAEYFAALQRGRARSRSPHATLLAAAAIVHFTAFHPLQGGTHKATAPAFPEPHLSAAILKRNEIAERAASNIPPGWEGPARVQRAASTFVHLR